MDLWTAFILGLMGSLHCVGMCGPIAMALPLSTLERWKIIAQSTIYQIGRVVSYTLMGIGMGIMGWGVAFIGYQKHISIGIGVTLIISAIFSFSLESQLFKFELATKFYRKLQSYISRNLQIEGPYSSFKIGFFNGFLPCGLVYVALAGAVLSGEVWTGGLYMTLFGIGTIPLMLTTMIFSNVLRNRLTAFRKWIPVGLVVIGLIFIYRGAVLEVPLDLRFWEANNFPVMCH